MGDPKTEEAEAPTRDPLPDSGQRCSADSAKLAWAIQDELHGTIWDPDHRDMSPENLPPWWVIRKEHHEAQLVRFREDIENLLEELHKDEPDAMSVFDLYGEMQRGLGRVHGSLGRLPGMCHLDPEGTYVPFTEAMFLARLFLLDRYEFRRVRSKAKASREASS